MDMDGMNMDGMDMSGGMDMSSNTNFVATNMYIAAVYWAIVGAVVGVLFLRRMVDFTRRFWRKRLSKRRLSSTVARPGNIVSQIYDTTVAIFREASYPQFIYFSHPIGRYFSPLPVGRWLLLCVYWFIVLTMLWSNTILSPDSSIYAYKWEIVGFRAAWISVTQLPLVYCLSCKVNVISLITGISYERLNWLHRWVSRTIFFTVIVHWTFFFQEWVIADFVSFEMSMMPMVVYGFGAWGVITWMVLSGFGYFRAKQYEFFVWQHLASAAVLLWLVWVHVPAYAAYNVWLAVGFVAFDRCARLAWTLYRNVHLQIGSPKTEGMRGVSVGYEASIQALPGGFVQLRVPMVKFSWKAGQHVFVSAPRLGFGQSHPFTIANDPESSDGAGDRYLELYIHARSGFTGQLLRKAKSPAPSNDTATLRVFLSGPFGTPPQVDAFETVVFVAASSGASFTVPIFQSLARHPYCARRIFFFWVVRDPCQLAAFSAPILSAVASAESSGVEVQIAIFVTGSSKTHLPYLGSDDVDSSSSSSSNGKTEECKLMTSTRGRVTAPLLAEPDADLEGKPAAPSLSNQPPHSFTPCACHLPPSQPSPSALSEHPLVSISCGCRPVLDHLIRPAVEGAEGETAILGCGSGGFTASLRTYVAGLSDERAVHKGTGAQGLFLFTESYGL